jgi:hypothetical protein
MPKKPATLLVGIFMTAMLAVSAINLWVLPRGTVWENGGSKFNINQLVEANQWDESAPIVLTNHFRRVEVKRVGNKDKNGIGFESELVRTFGVKGVTHTNPIDIRHTDGWLKLFIYTQYQSKATCSVSKHTHLCNLSLVWDSKNSSPYRTFVTLRIGQSSFAMVDSNLLRNVLGVTQW